MAPHPKKIRLRRKFIDCLATARLPHPLCQVTARVRGATITVVVGGGEETPYFGFFHSLVPAELSSPTHWFPCNVHEVGW